MARLSRQRVARATNVITGFAVSVRTVQTEDTADRARRIMHRVRGRVDVVHYLCFRR